MQYRRKFPPPQPWPNPERLAAMPKDKLVYASVAAIWHCFAGTAFLLHASMVDEMVAAYYANYASQCVPGNGQPREPGYCINKGANIETYIKPPVRGHKDPRACQPPCRDDQQLFAFTRDKMPNKFASVGELRNVVTGNRLWSTPKEIKGGQCFHPCGWACVIVLLF